ncbi:MAG: hypothetical protein CMJ78_10820 [Planctomycetaceae bacterium]|nr:hypothetical protein [Planctomycetaceae bacterium]
MQSFLLAALVIGACGCSTTELFHRDNDFEEATVRNPANRCVALWTPTEGHGLNNEPCRGFAGQVFFFPRGSSEPVQVNGKVRVYVFDDQGEVEEQTKPVHQFDFEAGAWNTYLHDSQFGPCYQLFIPYTRKGNHKAECVVRLRMKPDDGGPTVYSKLIEVELPGFDKKNAEKPVVERIDRQDKPKMVGSTIELAAATEESSLLSKKDKATNIVRAEKIIRSRLTQMAATSAVNTKTEELPPSARELLQQAKASAASKRESQQGEEPFFLDLTDQTEIKPIETASEEIPNRDHYVKPRRSLKPAVQPASQRHPLLEESSSSIEKATIERPVRKHPLQDFATETLENGVRGTIEFNDQDTAPTATPTVRKSLALPSSSPESVRARTPASYWELRPNTPKGKKSLSGQPVEGSAIEEFDFDDPTVSHLIDGKSTENERHYDGVAIDSNTPDEDFVERNYSSNWRFRSLSKSR